jgi:hypothetical protein
MRRVLGVVVLGVMALASSACWYEIRHGVIWACAHRPEVNGAVACVDTGYRFNTR